ncbi:thiosulfate sulfurtransferase PspE precursor [Andreesenia angusta]|uniref:Thiosulfate sulfurtransferase PspE n=1 Tax=Andreesenia angusta TaxID=39480 RepID=A0A1S1V5D0_9FIRM|nr:rhodanese-like domain-containing protein [Andreesenia angusta]OHW61782.1 thiosulfate sulfurtransferase PspE precursor [Andreesenia angusta]
MGLLNLFSQNPAASLSDSQLKEMLQSENPPILLDVRSPGEYQVGHIPGSSNVPVQFVADTMNQNNIQLDKTLVLYCQSGARSAQACQILRNLGYTAVYNFGGIRNWSYGFQR